jgi:hypothetical protein
MVAHSTLDISRFDRFERRSSSISNHQTPRGDLRRSPQSVIKSLNSVIVYHQPSLSSGHRFDGMSNIPLKQLGNPQKSPILSPACASCSSAWTNASLNMTIISLITSPEPKAGGVRYTFGQAVGLVVNIACCSYLQYYQPSHLKDGTYISFHHFSTCPAVFPGLQIRD